MPRPRNPANEPGRARTEKWRKRLHEVGGFETDAVDSAIAASVSVYLREALLAGSEKNVGRVEALERMAAAFLVSRSSEDEDEPDVDPDAALIRVRARLRRQDIEEVAAAVFANPPVRPPVTA
jgi:hypothetical protein